MPSSSAIKEEKLDLCPLYACCCCEQSCTTEFFPLCYNAGKCCCCTGWCGLEWPPIWCECGEAIWTQERGFYEENSKCCCLYGEYQCPPGRDIGCGLCGLTCCRSSGQDEERDA